MNRKLLTILLWVTVAGFGLSWIGSQCLLAKYQNYIDAEELMKLEEANQHLSIEQERLELELVLNGPGLHVNSLNHWSNLSSQFQNRQDALGPSRDLPPLQSSGDRRTQFKKPAN